MFCSEFLGSHRLLSVTYFSGKNVTGIGRLLGSKCSRQASSYSRVMVAADAVGLRRTRGYAVVTVCVAAVLSCCIAYGARTKCFDLV